VSLRLPIAVIEQLAACCAATDTSRIQFLSDAVRYLEGTRDLAKQGYFHEGNHEFRWPANPKEWFENLVPAMTKRFKGLERKSVGTSISPQDHDLVRLFATDVRITERQVFHAAILIRLKFHGYTVPDNKATNLSKFWEKLNRCSEGDAVYCLLEKGTESWKELSLKRRRASQEDGFETGQGPSRYENRYEYPAYLKGETMLIDASVFLVCLSQDVATQLFLHELLASPCSAVITSATLSEIALRGSALFHAREETPVEKILPLVLAGNVPAPKLEPWAGRLRELIKAIPTLPIESRDCTWGMQWANIDHIHFSRLVSLAAIHRLRNVQSVWMLRAAHTPNNYGGRQVQLCLKNHKLGDLGFKFLKDLP
jgi:hypothetical protein